MDPNNLNTQNKVNTQNNFNTQSNSSIIKTQNKNNIKIDKNTIIKEENKIIKEKEENQIIKEKEDIRDDDNTKIIEIPKLSRIETETTITERSCVTNVETKENENYIDNQISTNYQCNQWEEKDETEWKDQNEEKDSEKLESERSEIGRLESEKNELEIIEQTLGRDETMENVGVGMTERRGGLSWVRTSNGTLLPQIENTWLKHIITSLQSNKPALMNFFNNLENCLIESVQFLYREGIKPYLGDVANQMKRSICDNFWSAAEVAYVSLHCKNAVRLQIELRVKGEMGWVVYLLEEPKDFKGFVDTHSTVNRYSYYYWRQLNMFASSILALSHMSKIQTCNTNSDNTNNGPGGKEREERDFNGGRYAFAERLKNEVEAFKDMRLGEVVHLVQLAIYSGVFVYAQRILLPVAACEKTAQELFPKLKKSRYPICTCINEVLKIVSVLVDGRKNGLVLAQLKQQFMLQFNRELNPLSFGYRKLQNLLLSDLFNNNYHLFVPIDSPHRTHIQHRRYPIPPGCKVFRQSKLQFDRNKFPMPLTDFYDQYHSVCPLHPCSMPPQSPTSSSSSQTSGSPRSQTSSQNGNNEQKECLCVWKIDFETLPKVVQDTVKDFME